ncbi:TPA: plasmid partition protein ParG [Klebsiella pneumoniae]
MSKVTSTLSAGRPSARTDKAKTATLASLADDAGSMKRVNFELSAEQHAKLKIHAAKAGKSIKELLTEYVAGLPD